MSVFQPGKVGYGFSQALLDVPNAPIVAQRDPTTNDKAAIGTIWIDSATNNAFILTSIVDNIATWIMTGGGSFADDFVTDSGTAVPIAGVLEILGGANINTAGATNIVTVNLDNSISLPATNSAGTSGVISIGGDRFISAFPGSNTFIGGDSGNLTLNPGLAIANVAVGNTALLSLTTGPGNVAVGALSLTDCTTGQANTAVGTDSLETLITGSHNIALGYQAGLNYVGAEGSNILIGNAGVAAESNKIRIGTSGTGTGLQNQCFIAGVAGVTVSNLNVVTINTATGQLGSEVLPTSVITLDGDTGAATGSTILLAGGHNITTAAGGSTVTFNVSGTTQHSLLLGNATGSINSLGVATNGQLAIGSTGADPVLASLTAGSGISVTPGAGSITIASTVTPGIVTLDGDSGSATGDPVLVTASAAGGSLSFSGAGSTLTFNTTTANHSIGIGVGTTILACPNTVAVGGNALNLCISGGSNTAIGYEALNLLTAGTSNIALGVAAGTRYTSSETGNIVIGSLGVIGDASTIRIGGYPGPIAACFIDGIAGVTVSNANFVTVDTLTGQLGATASAGIGTLAGDGGGTATGSTVTFAGGEADAGNSVFFTASGSTVQLNLSDLILDNTFLGGGSGNVAVTGTDNTAVGVSALHSVTTGVNNVAIGFNALEALTTAVDNVAIGWGALSSLVDNNNNIAIGAQALSGGAHIGPNIGIGFQTGTSYGATESRNICIGYQVIGVGGEDNTTRIGLTTGPNAQTACYLGGIFGTTVDAGTGVPVLIDSTGLLGTVLSSRRYKDNINDMETASDPVLNLRPVTFCMKNDPTRRKQYGLIAEEVQDIFPALVVKNDAGDPETVRYHDLPVLLLNEIQKQRNIISELIYRLERLEGRSKYE